MSRQSPPAAPKVAPRPGPKLPPPNLPNVYDNKGLGPEKVEKR